MVSQAPKWRNAGGTPQDFCDTLGYPWGRQGQGQRNGLTWREVEKICAVQEADGTLRGLRNSAILRAMSDGLLRVTGVTALPISDLKYNTLRVRFSKTGQEGQGEHLYLCKDTRRIVQEWLKRSGLTKGYLFRRMTVRGDNLYRDKETGELSHLTADGVRWIIKQCAARGGLPIRCRGIHCGLEQPSLSHDQDPL